MSSNSLDLSGIPEADKDTKQSCEGEFTERGVVQYSKTKHIRKNTAENRLYGRWAGGEYNACNEPRITYIYLLSVNSMKKIGNCDDGDSITKIDWST